MLNFLYRVVRYLYSKMQNFFSQQYGIFLFKINKIYFAQGITFKGIPIVSIQGKVKIGTDFKVNSSVDANPIGRNQKNMIIVRKNAELTIGNNTGMSGTTIVCQKQITIGDNVKFGGNVCLYDTDFHSLDANHRLDSVLDRENTVRKNIYIGDNVFIGAHSTILKGVTIGENSIVGACSVVTKNIPSNQIWAGNPAQYIRSININAEDKIQ